MRWYKDTEAGAMIERNIYLNQLLDWKDKNIIKVLTGIRRCGKVRF